MPESKHRRGGKNRPREHETHAPEKKPAPSAPWVPVVGTSLLVVGVLIILAGYLFSDLTRAVPVTGPNTGLVVGFVLLTVGFGFLTRWR
jgi:hypothetical protein